MDQNKSTSRWKPIDSKELIWISLQALFESAAAEMLVSGAITKLNQSQNQKETKQKQKLK